METTEQIKEQAIEFLRVRNIISNDRFSWMITWNNGRHEDVVTLMADFYLSQNVKTSENTVEALKKIIRLVSSKHDRNIIEFSMNGIEKVKEIAEQALKKLSND